MKGLPKNFWLRFCFFLSVIPLTMAGITAVIVAPFAGLILAARKWPMGTPIVLLVVMLVGLSLYLTKASTPK